MSRWGSFHRGVWVAMVSVLAVAVPIVYASSDRFLPPGQVNLDSFLSETQQGTPDPDRIDNVWWIPTVFWVITNSQDSNVSAGELASLTEILEPFVIVGVVAGDIGPFGGVTFVPESRLRSQVTCRTETGDRIESLADEAVNADARSLLSILKPVMANIVGPMGENMHFYLFPATDESGVAYADPRREGSFSVAVGEEIYSWRLPLSSLLKPKTCPRCQEPLNGAWSYCPWDGAELGEP